MVLSVFTVNIEFRGGLFGDDDPEDDVSPDRKPAEDYQEQHEEPHDRSIYMEEVGQPSADAGDRAVGARAVELAGFRLGFLVLLPGGVAAALAEVRGCPHSMHRRAHRVEGDDAHRRGDDLAEYLGNAYLDVAHGFGVVFGQAAAYVVKITPEYTVSIFVEGESLRADIYVYCLFHSRRGILGLIFPVYYYFGIANIIHILVLCNTKY